jgi:hypothetical protein
MPQHILECGFGLHRDCHSQFDEVSTRFSPTWMDLDLSNDRGDYFILRDRDLSCQSVEGQVLQPFSSYSLQISQNISRDVDRFFLFTKH